MGGTQRTWTLGPSGGHAPFSGDPRLTCTETTVVPGLASSPDFTRAAASVRAARAWGRRAKALAAGKAVPLCHRQSRGQGGACTLGRGCRLSFSPTSSPCRRGCQSSGSSLGSSPSELLELELELGLGPRTGSARQAKRRGPPGKIPFREFSRQWSGEGLVAGPGQMAIKKPSVRQPNAGQEGPLPKRAGSGSWSLFSSAPYKLWWTLNSVLSGHGEWTDAKPEPGPVPSHSGKAAGDPSRSLKTLEAISSLVRARLWVL